MSTSTGFEAARLSILEHIATGAALRDVLEEIVLAVESEADGLLSSIIVVERGGGTLRCGAAPHLPGGLVAAIDGEAGEPAGRALGAVVARPERVVVADIRDHPRWANVAQLALPHGLTAFWSEPIRGREREILGTFVNWISEARGPTTSEIALLEAAAHLAAVALLRDRTETSLRESEERARQIARLYAVSTAVNEALIRFRDPTQLFEAACRIAVDKGLAALAWVGVLEEATGRIDSVAHFGKGNGYLERILLRPLDPSEAQGPAARALSTGAPAISNDIESDPHFIWKDEAVARGLRSCAVFPFRFSADQKGILAIYGDRTGFFQEEEITVLTALAGDLSFAVESAHLQQERDRLVSTLRERVKELTLLHRVARILHATRAVDASLLTDLVDLIPLGWQFPEICGARIRWDGIEAETRGWVESPYRLAAPLGSGSVHGTVEVVYASAAEGLDDPFLDEERELLRSLAELLSSHFGRLDAERELRDRQSRLQALHSLGELLRTEEDRDLVLAGVLRLLGEHLGAVHCSYGIHDEAGARLRVTHEYRDTEIGRPNDIDLSVQGTDSLPRLSPRDPPLVIRDVHQELEAPGAELCTALGVGALMCRVLEGEGQARSVLTVQSATPRSWTEAEVALFEHFAERTWSTLARHEAEDRLRQAQKLDAVGQLASGVAHDFNNLLSVILSYASLLLETIPEADATRRDVAEIEKAAVRAGELTTQLLAFSRRQMANPEVLDLARVLHGMERMIRRIVPESVEIDVRIGDGVHTVRADRGQIEQVIVNLVMNARDAMPAGGRLVLEVMEVALDREGAERGLEQEPGSWVLLSVSDTGHGMDAATRSRVFEPFFTTKEQGRGTGLGLSMAYGIVKQSQGLISVDTAPGAGATFRIHLPRVTEAPAPTDALDEDVVEAAAGTGSGTVLVVEDVDQVREVVSSVLRTAGYRVITASDGPSALEAAAREQPIDLLLTDVVMPGMSGPQLAERMLGSRPGLRVVFMSGYAAESVFSLAEIDPDAGFLSKPVTPERIRSAVRMALDGGGAARTPPKADEVEAGRRAGEWRSRADTSAAAEDDSATSERPGRRSAGSHILVVDDEPAVAAVATRVLERLGYQVTSFTTPCDALDALRARPSAFDALVTDLAMAPMGGLELVERAREHRPDLPVVVVSGDIATDDIEQGLALGVYAYVAKSDMVEELEEALLTELAGAREDTVPPG